MTLRCALALVLSAGLLGCAAPRSERPPAEIRYVGSSTVALLVRDAEPVYGRAVFTIETATESVGGERAVVAGEADLAGVADNPRPGTLESGVTATLVGRDAIAVIVHADNPLQDLSFEQLKAAFTGGVTNWSELGGPELEIRPLIVGPDSATHRIFRRLVLGGDEYGNCRVVAPDRDILAAVADDPGAIGQISLSFLSGGAAGLRAVSVEGEAPKVTNFQYPIARPLYMLRREGNPAVEAFVDWVLSDEGQRVVMQHFVGARVVGAFQATAEKSSTGVLIVRTETYPVYDGGVYYYPHRPYTILTRHGEPVRRVRNHRGENDEKPTRVRLEQGVYLIRAELDGQPREVFVRVEPGKTVDIDVEEVERSGRP
jgi:phosphate transport system substrate-binding protein